MQTKENIKDCKNCNGKGHVDGVPCQKCCSHAGRAVRDPQNEEKYVCEDCGASVKAPK